MALVYFALSVVQRVAQPDGLLCDFQRNPAVGVRPAPAFTWIVPPCTGPDATPGHIQTAYQIVVSDKATEKTVWDSGRVSSNESTVVPYSGPALAPATQYQWVVRTWSSSGSSSQPCASDPSEPSTFITSLKNFSAQWIGHGDKPTFIYARKEITVPPGVVTASLFVTATNQDPMLSAYKLYIDGNFVNLGPGRGEAPVWGGDGIFRYDSI